MRPKTSTRALRLPTRGIRLAGLAAIASLVTLVPLVSEASAAQAPVGLGTADSFAVLAGSAVTNTGPSTINGDLGVHPGTAISGFPPGTVNGSIHAADAVAAQAQADLTTAYNDAASRGPALAISGDLGGLLLTPGVYRSGSSLGLTGTLTLDAQGDPNAVFVFQAGSSLTTASASRVNLVNGAQACNVFWQVGSSATLGSASVFAGNILALASISMDDAVTLNGRALARNGAVTMINDTVTAARCATAGGAPGAGAPGGDTGGGTPGGGPGDDGTPGGGDGGGDGDGDGTALFTTVPGSVARLVTQFGTSRCVRGPFRVAVNGLFIRRVVFSLGRRVIARDSRSPFEAVVRPRAGIRTVTALVTFRDGTRAATLRMRFRSCRSANRRVDRPSRRPRTPGGFTG